MGAAASDINYADMCLNEEPEEDPLKPSERKPCPGTRPPLSELKAQSLIAKHCIHATESDGDVANSPDSTP